MTADPSDQSIRVHSDPHDEWFRTEVEAITAGLLHMSDATTEADLVALGPHMHALTRLAVRVLAQRGEPFTGHDIFQMIEQREIPMPQGTTPADLEPLLRRLRRRVEQSNTTQAGRGGRS
jgi:hypothetical protein